MASNVTVADALEAETLTKVASNVVLSDAIWSPDGSEILFTRDGDLYRIFSDGSGETKIVESSAQDHFWSPDGSKISYLKYEGDALSLWIMDENGTETQLLEPVYGVEHYTYTWFPSSSKIAYTYSYDYDFLSGLYFINPDGSNDQRVCGGPNQNIAVSPDESKIVYNRFSTADPTDIYILDLNQNNSRYKLANGSISQQTQAGQPQVWSSDGSKIVYCSYEYRNNDGIESGNYCIYTIKVDGTEITQLTFDSDSSSPVFSPDGSKIVFVSDITGNKDIWVMDADGNNKTQLTTDSAPDLSPVWNPDGTKIAFCSKMSGTYDIWVMELKNQNQTEEALVIDILNPEDGFSVDAGSPEIIKAKITDSSGANITGLSWVNAIFSNGDDNISLFDDGLHSDENPEDGVYSNEWVPVNVTGAETSCTLNVSAQDSLLGFAEDSVTGLILSPDLIDDADSVENQTEESTNVTDEIDEQSNETSTSDDSSSSSSSSGGSSHSSSSGSGGGGSPEPQSNVEIKELSQVFVTNGKEVKFDFTENATCVVYVGFDAKKTVGKITTIAEQLKNKSTLVSNLTEGDVYKYFNVWVGNSGYATSENIENPVICFKVEKAWVEDNNISQDSITLNRYSDDSWEQFQVNMSGEDANYMYFAANVSGYSSFAITGKVKSTFGQKEENLSYTRSVNSTDETNNTGINSENEAEKRALGFEMVFGIVSLLGVFLYKRK